MVYKDKDKDKDDPYMFRPNSSGRRHRPFTKLTVGSRLCVSVTSCRALHSRHLVCSTTMD